jgi:hypothetical protein
MFTVENARSARRFPRMTGVKKVEMRGGDRWANALRDDKRANTEQYIGGKYEYEIVYQYTTGNNGKLPQIHEDRKRKD